MKAPSLLVGTDWRNRPPNSILSPMAKKKTPGFAPGPFFSKWWGPMADQTFKGHFSKKAAYSSTRKDHSTQHRMTPIKRCPCEAFTLCDERYQNMTEDERDTWRNATKKPGISGYELWMKECLYSMIHYKTMPITPTESGGFTCNLISGDGEEAPPDFIGQAPPGPWPPGNPCGFCMHSPPGSTPSKYTMEIYGLQFEGKRWNGYYVLPQSALECVWLLDTPDYIFEYVIEIRTNDDHATFTLKSGNGILDFGWNNEVLECWGPRILHRVYADGIFGPEPFAKTRRTTFPPP